MRSKAQARLLEFHLEGEDKIVIGGRRTGELAKRGDEEKKGRGSGSGMGDSRERERSSSMNRNLHLAGMGVEGICRTCQRPGIGEAPRSQCG